MINSSFRRKGKGMLKRAFFCMCLCAVSLQGIAQDGILENRSEEPRFKAENFGFNAIDLYQSRFLYGDSVRYVNEKFNENISVGVALRFDKILQRIPVGYIPSSNYGLYIEKDINKLNALRLNFFSGKYQLVVFSTQKNQCFCWVRSNKVSVAAKVFKTFH